MYSTPIIRHRTDNAFRGEQCCARLFAGQAPIRYRAGRRKGLENLTLKIASDVARPYGKDDVGCRALARADAG